MSKQKKAKSERLTHPLVHNRVATRREQRLGMVPPTAEEANAAIVDQPNTEAPTVAAPEESTDQRLKLRLRSPQPNLLRNPVRSRRWICPTAK